jgi:putative chitinase
MDLAKFFDGVRDRPFGGKLKQAQVDGCSTLIAAFEKARWPVAHAAYGLATAFHETAATMQPIAEYGRGKGRSYGKPDPKTGQTYYGRGYVQLTWLFNYEKAQKELGYPLVSQPDLAMRPDIAADVMVRGMQEGWFTGKANKTYLDKTPPNYFDARRIINGTDKAALVAGYAKSFELALVAAGYGKPAPELPKAAPRPVPPPTPTPAPAIRNDGKYETPPPKTIWQRLARVFGN